MSRLAGAVQAFLDGDGWHPVAIGERAWAATVEGRTGRWQATFEVRPGEVLVVYAVAPLDVPPERRAAAAEYVTRATCGLPLGVVELDLDTGHATVRNGVDTEDIPDEALPRLVRTTAYANAVLADRYLPGLLAVALGAATAIEALPEDERPVP